MTRIRHQIQTPDAGSRTAQGFVAIPRLQFAHQNGEGRIRGGARGALRRNALQQAAKVQVTDSG